MHVNLPESKRSMLWQNNKLMFGLTPINCSGDNLIISFSKLSTFGCSKKNSCQNSGFVLVGSSKSARNNNSYRKTTFSFGRFEPEPLRLRDDIFHANHSLSLTRLSTKLSIFGNVEKTNEMFTNWKRKLVANCVRNCFSWQNKWIRLRV